MITHKSGGKTRVSKFSVNIFYIISCILTLVLAAYSWSVILPSFEGTSAYPSLRTVMGILVVVLLGAAGIQIYLAIRKEEEPS